MLYTFSAYTMTIVQKIIITEIFKPQVLSSHATCLHTRLTKFLMNFRSMFRLAFYSRLSGLMNALAVECLRKIS